MTKQQKEAISAAYNKIEEGMQDIETIRGEIQDDYDDLTEKQQEGKKGEELQDILTNLDDVTGSLQSALDGIHPYM